MTRADSAPPPGPRRSIARVIPWLGYAISIGCLIWVYYGFDWKQELPKLAATQWRWITLAILSDWVVYLAQGARWTVLLGPLGNFSVWKSTQAIYIGLFANEVLPLRSGEIIRCYLQGRWTGLPLSVVISSVFMERLLDGVWLTLGFWLAARVVKLPGWLHHMSEVLLMIVMVMIGVMVVATFYKHHAHNAVANSRFGRLLRPLVDGIHSMGNSPSFALAGLLSLIYLLLQIIPLYALIRGYGIQLTVWQVFVMLIILRLGTVLPQAPGNLGSFQALVILSMSLFGFKRAESTGLATLAFLVITVPLWLGGFVALMLTRMRLGEIHRDAHESLANH